MHRRTNKSLSFHALFFVLLALQKNLQNFSYIFYYNKLCAKNNFILNTIEKQFLCNIFLQLEYL